MKKLSFLLLILCCLISCEQQSKGPRLAISSGRVNHVNVVIAKEVWQGKVGDALRQVLAAPVEGLQQEEPLFTLTQIPLESFKGFAKENRTFIKVQTGDAAAVDIAKNVYARPQIGITVTAPSEEGLIELITARGEEIVKAFKAQELATDQRRISKSLKNDEQLEKALGVSLRFPSVYRYAKTEPDFFWMRKPLTSGDLNILVYEVPLRVIDQDTNTVLRLVRMRDSIGGKKIPTDEGRFITERAFAPSLYETTIDGKFAWLTRGTWEVDGQLMAGPYVNYAVKDEANNRYLVLEGFIFSPSGEKRDNMFELEAIIKSARFVKTEPQ